MSEPNLTHCKVIITCPTGEIVNIPTVYCNELVSSLKLILIDYIETCFYSSYNFEYLYPLSNDSTSSTSTLNEYQEIGQIVLESLTNNSPSTKVSANNEYVELYLKIVNESYDVKKARAQVKRLKDVLITPPNQIGSELTITNESVVNNKDISNNNLASTLAAVTSIEDKDLPTLDTILPSNDIKLSDFYEETLHKLTSHQPSRSTNMNGTTNTNANANGTNNNGVSKTNKNKNKSKTATLASSSSTNNDANSIEFTSIIKSIILSNYNPPPSNRQLQGDLIYIELDAIEGKFYITGIASGFYLNRSTSSENFDPRPHLEKKCFCDTLFHLLCQLSESFKKKWNKYILELKKLTRESMNIQYDAVGSLTPKKNSINNHLHPLDVFSKQYYDHLQTNNQTELIFPLQWNIALPDQISLTKFQSDAWRHTEDLTNTFGMQEDKGPIREWNDEIQTLRDMKPTNLLEKLSTARLLYRTMTEFVESCQLIIMGISDGHINSVNPMDPFCNHVFVYNNIFISLAVDTKETFKLCSGLAACHKIAGQDHKNQRYLQSFCIEELHSVASVIIDFKGIRYVCQSVIPGILFCGGGAKLMYGIMEYNKSLTNKKSVWPLVEKIGKVLHMSPRQIPLYPVPVSAEFVDTVTMPMDPTIPADRSPIQIDDGEDMEPVPAVTTTAGAVVAGVTTATITSGHSTTTTATAVEVEYEPELSVCASDLSIISEQNDTWKVTDGDSNTTNPTATSTASIPHIGPIEMKLLKGTDQRIYVLELVSIYYMLYHL